MKVISTKDLNYRMNIVRVDKKIFNHQINLVKFKLSDLLMLQEAIENELVIRGY